MDRLLARIGETVWIAALATLASLGAVTALAAWSAALDALREGDSEPGITGAWWARFRSQLPATLGLSAGLCALAGVAAFDLAWAWAAEPGPVRHTVLAAGGAIAVTVLALAPHLAATDARSGPRERVRAAVALAGIQPAGTALLVLAGAATVLAAAMAPALCPVFFAAHTALTNTLHRAARAAWHRAAQPR